MLTIATLNSADTAHPLEETLHQQLSENGYSLKSPTEAKVLICMGSGLEGFDASALQQLENQLVERFLGAELFLLARAFPFARIRVGLNANHQLLVACPLDESTLYRLVRLLDQFKRLSPVDYEQKMGTFKDLPTLQTPEENYTATPQSNLAPLNSDALQIQHGSQASTTLGWQEKLDHWHLRETKEQFTIPPELSHAGIQQVLQSTTQKQSRQDPMGQVYGIYGFPDLVRPQSRVLLVTPDGGIIALHRKQDTTILSPLVEDLLFSTKHPFPKWAQEMLADKLNSAAAFALEGMRVYGKKEQSVQSATQQQSAKEEGRSNSVIASLILHWSSR